MYFYILTLNLFCAPITFHNPIKAFWKKEISTDLIQTQSLQIDFFFFIENCFKLDFSNYWCIKYISFGTFLISNKILKVKNSH